MSKKTSSCSSSATTAPRPARIDTEVGNDTATNAATGAATGAAAGLGIWGLVTPVVNLLGFTASGIASGSTAASMMASAAVANGGGVAAGSAVATMQSIGVVGLATPIGLGLVAGGAAVGGAVLLIKSKLSTPTAVNAEDGAHTESEEKGLWVLIENSADSGRKPTIRTFEDDYKARNAFLNSNATSKALFDPDRKMVLELGWEQSMNEIVSA